ncbi:MAG: hypothetical protein L3K14_01560 [Thermoplasmata archaeon]|nr:hypothetical protein [Thermoplasmata archaeon]
MSAVATVLALMLFVSFLATFVLGQLNSQMAQKEFQHQLLVENQMSRLQTAILQSVAAFEGNGSTFLSSPVTLSSGGAPPFGVPSGGSLQPEPATIATAARFSISSLSNAPVEWNDGTACFAAGSGTCTAGSGLEVYNFSGNHSAATPTVNGCAGGGCTVVYNVSGSFNTLSLTLSGATLGNVLYQVSGNWDNLTLNYGVTCSNHQSVTIIFSGNNDTYKLAATGCTSAPGASINTTFVGSSGNQCPYGSASRSDKFLGATWASSTGVYQNLTWRNALGTVSAPHTVPANGGNDHLTFANTSGYFQCLFTTSTTTGPYTLDFLSGVQAKLNNRYITPSAVAYDQGAVILGVQNGGSVMLSPPEVSFVQNPSGVAFSIMLVSVTGATGIATGFGTAAVISSILSVQNYQITDGKPGTQFLPFFYLNITTAYPQAWATFWASQGPVDPTGTTCVPGTGVTAANCLSPPYGRTSTIVVPINANQFDLTTIIAQVSIY